MSLSAQCPDRDSLWKRIVYLRDSSSVAPDHQLNELLSRLEDTKKCADPFDSIYTLLLQRIGWLTSLQKNFVQAVAFTRKSIDIIYKYADKPGINRKHLVKSYNNLRIFYDSLKQPSLEAESIDSCISIALNLKTGYEYVISLIYSRTESLFESGDYYRCINYSIIGEDITKASGYQKEHVFFYITWRINSLIFLRKFDEAESLILATISEVKKQGYTNFLGALYSSLAGIAEERQNRKMSLAYVRQSLFYDKKFKYFDGCSATLNNLGLILYHQQLHQYDTALFYYRQALTYASTISALNILDNIANVYVQKKEYDSAFIYFQKSFDIIKPASDEIVLLDIYRNNSLDKKVAEYIFGLTLDKADAYQSKYRSLKEPDDLKKAIQIYRSADKLLNEIKTGQSLLESRLFWRTASRRLFEHAIAASFLTNDYEGAFYFFEKSRAVLLQDQLNQINNISNVDIQQEFRVKRKISKLQNELRDSAISPTRNVEIQNELATGTQLLDRLEKLIKDRNPLYFQSIFDTSMISITDVQQNLLKNHIGLLEIFAGDSAVYSLLVTRDRAFFKLINKSDFDSTANAFTSYISNLSLLNRKFQDYTTTAHHLYKLIFGDNPVPEGRIIIAPDGHYFPFEALVTNNANPGYPVYFLNDHVVSYTYSARYLMSDFTVNDSAGAGNFLGVAPVQFAAALSLPALSGSDVSLQQIGSNFNDAKSFVAINATKNNFFHDYSRYKIIQLYTHASESSSNGEPVIYFADSSLYLSDLIIENKPFTKLIVLSACETGKGKLYQGEGVFSFNRGFAALGIPSSVTNLWSVDNKATYELTELFYKYLSEGLEIDVALQKAKLEFISISRRNRLPYYWAAPIVAGKTDAVVFKKTNSRMWLMIIGAFAVICLLFWGLWAKTRKKNAPFAN